MRHFLTLFSILLLSGLAACTSSTSGSIDQTALQQVLRSAARQEAIIDSATLADRMLSNPETLTLIDLRSADAFRKGSIEGAQRMDPPDLLSVEFSPERDLVLYDADGAVGAQVATVLRLKGVTSARHLAGGYAGWISHLTGKVEGAGEDVALARTAARRAAIACRFEGDYVAAAGLVPAAASNSAGYVPAVQPAVPPPAAASDSLGLGLGLGLGPAPEARPRGKLKIGEGC